MCGMAKYGKLFPTVRMVFHNTEVEDLSMRAPLSGIQIKFCPSLLADVGEVAHYYYWWW